MVLLITGASGAGKATVRRMITADPAPGVECVELVHVAPMNVAMTKEWRQRGAEAAVRRAIELQDGGWQPLPAGDPVAAVEIAAAPSAFELDGFAFCLLDIRPDVHAERLEARGDPAALSPHHQNFASLDAPSGCQPAAHAGVRPHRRPVRHAWDRIPALAGRSPTGVIDVSDPTPV